MKYANPALLDFPTDVYGMTTELKAAFIGAVQRVGTSPDKYLTLEGVLKVLIKHMKARFADNTDSEPALIAERKKAAQMIVEMDSKGTTKATPDPVGITPQEAEATDGIIVVDGVMKLK